MIKIKWPNDKKFVVCLSHDVDRVRKTYQIITNFFIEKRLYHLYSIFEKTNPYWCFEKIMNLEKKYDVRSTFFFLKERKKLEIFNPSTYALNLGKYDFNEPRIKKIIKKLDEGGWEIGLHGSYESYKNKKLMLKEKEELENVLGKSIIGIRQHYLNLNIPETWEIQKQNGFKYDASFGYNDKIGFREEKILPFKPFNDDFLVIPLNIMDSALYSAYTDNKIRWLKTIELIDFIEKKGGILSILWHQRVFNEKEFLGWSNTYEKIIIESQKRNAWIVPYKDLCQYLA